MCLWLENKKKKEGGGVRIKKKLFLLVKKNILKSLTQRCTESLSTSAVLSCKLLRSTVPNKQTVLNEWGVAKGGCWFIRQPWICLHTPSHGEHKLLVLHLFVFILFVSLHFLSFLTILYIYIYEINTTTEWRSLWKVWHFSVPSISSCRFLCHLCTTHFPRILIKSCPPLQRRQKVLSNHTAIVKEFYTEHQFEKKTSHTH